MASSSETDIEGDVEVDFSGNEEVDLHTQIHCKKNPGHAKFIPITEFKFEHLQENLRDPLVFDFVKATADLTVRIEVKIISPDRPEFWPNSNIPYPHFKLRGKKKTLNGSGIIDSITKYIEGQCDNKIFSFKNKPYQSCPCATCKKSDTPSKVWWEIDIFTAMHVVFDNIEAEHSSVRLFYDSPNSPKTIIEPSVGIHDKARENAKHADSESESHKNWLKNAHQDVFSFQCTTCDERLAETLENMTKQRKSLARAVHMKYLNSRDVDKFNFIVSHPHGCSKQVSIGYWQEVTYPSCKCHGKFTYTTSTCPGSSGALVVNLGYIQEGNPHKGSLLKSPLNYSCFGIILNESYVSELGEKFKSFDLKYQQEMVNNRPIANFSDEASYKEDLHNFYLKMKHDIEEWKRSNNIRSYELPDPCGK